MKRIFKQGITAGIVSAAASSIYFKIYQSALGTEFDKIINVSAIIGASIIATMLMAGAYALLLKLKKQKFNGVLNILIAVLSFASILSPMSMSLPLDIETPELFPGLVVPMHFFPALIFFAIAPFFNNTDKNKILA